MRGGPNSVRTILHPRILLLAYFRKAGHPGKTDHFREADLSVRIAASMHEALPLYCLRVLIPEKSVLCEILHLIQVGVQPSPWSLVEPRILGLGLPQYRNLRIGILPQQQKILIEDPGPRIVSRKRIGSTELELRQSADGIGINDAAVIDKVLELRSSLRAVMAREIDRAAHVNRI
jgi:hypothetical protein